jgi:hypothetical protein
MTHRIAFAACLASLFFVANSLLADPAPAEPAPPMLRIPKMLHAPVIDGKIDPKEWQGAAAVTGFPNLNGEMSLPQFLQPVWYLGYDDKNLYMAFKYPIYPKGTLHASSKTKEDAENNILWDDHSEIEICNKGRETAVSGYFFKIMTNPWDVVADQKVRWSIGQQGWEYSTGATAKSSFTPDTWEQEIAIPIKNLGVTQIKDGDNWVLQLVSAQDSGSSYWTWTPATWLAFNKFPSIVFDSTAAAVQFDGVGEWMKGDPDFTFDCFNPQSKPVHLKIAVKIVSPDGKTLLDQTDPVTLAPGESSTQHVKAMGLDLGDGKRSNRVSFHITNADTGDVYYDNNTALQPLNSTDVQGYLQNLTVARRPVQPKLQFAYMPSFNKLTVATDIGLFGIDPKYKLQAKYLAAWFSDKTGNVIGKNSIPFSADGTAKLTFSFAPLPEGIYDITLQIQDEGSKPLLSKTQTFEQKHFPFQDFTGGLAEEVVKPYTPVKTDDKSFETVGNQLGVTPNGLIATVHNKLVPQDAGRDILAGPMTIVATQDGKQIPLGDPAQAFAWQPSEVPTKADGTAVTQLAGMTLKIKGQADYTGQYFVDMDIVPNGKVSLDGMELQIPVADPCDTVFSYSPRDSVVLYDKTHPWTGNPPVGPLWNNLGDRPTNPYIMYVGDGERGIYWYTDSYEGFWIDHNRPHIFLDKREHDTVLRVAIFNHPVVLDHPRHLHFAVMAVPTKPLPADARVMQWSGRMHIGGASWWGTIGCFVFPFNDEQWQNWINGGEFTYNGKQYPGQCALLPAPPMDAHGKWLLQKGHEYGSYRDAMAIGYLQPELKVMAGEWIGGNNPDISPDPSLLGYKDAHGNSAWPLPEQRSNFGKDACVQSSYDYESYYFYLMAKNTGAGGYWWDWGSMAEGHSMDKGEMYLDDEGQPQPILNVFMVRKFYERIARIVQEAGVPDTNNCYAPGAVYQMPWLTRINAWESLYLESSLDDMFDAWGVDKYRMQIGKFSGIPVQNVMNLNIDFKDHRARTVIALALLEDNGVCGADGDRAGMDMLQKAGIFDESAVWVPYWRSEKIAKASEAGLLISGYQLDDTHRLTLVVVNPTEKDITTDIDVPALSGGKATDDESGQSLTAGGKQIAGLVVKRHDFKLITLQ